MSSFGVCAEHSETFRVSFLPLTAQSIKGAMHWHKGNTDLFVCLFVFVCELVGERKRRERERVLWWELKCC